MFHTFRENKPRQLILIAVSLAMLVLLTAAAGTRAWLTNRRTLQTITPVQFSTLDLTGSGIGTIPVNLGEIKIKDKGSKEIEFRIYSKPGTRYILQLGHTTNLPLTYEIYLLTGENDETRTLITGRYLNQNSTTLLAETQGDYHSATYGSANTNSVQKNAEPLYWVSNSQAHGKNDFDKYVLKISWDASPNITDKETEMIFLTAGLEVILNETT